MDTYFGLITKKGKAERVQEDEIEKKEGEIEKQKSVNQCDKEERVVIIDQLIDKNSPWKRTKEQILNELNPPLPD